MSLGCDEFYAYARTDRDAGLAVHDEQVAQIETTHARPLSPPAATRSPATTRVMRARAAVVTTIAGSME